MKLTGKMYESEARRDTDRCLAAMKKISAKAAKDPAYSLKLLVGTGMYTKTGKLKKQFR